MTTRLRVTYFSMGRSKPQRLLIAVNGTSSVTEARQEIQKALTSLADNGTTATVKTLWTQDGFLLPDAHGIGALVDSGDEIYASEKKTNVAPFLSSSGVGNAVKREREEPAAVDAAPAAGHAPAADGAPAVATAKPAKSNVKTEPKAETAPKAKKARGASAYNIYMSSAMTRWKAENPGESHKEAFAACARLWRSAPENPKNGGTASGAQSSPQSSGLPSTGVDQDSDAESGVRPAGRVQLASSCGSVRHSEKADVVADQSMIDCLVAVAMEPTEDDGDGEALGDISAIFAAAEKKKKKKEKKEKKKKKKEKKNKEK